MSASAKPLTEVGLDGPGTDTIAVGAHGDRVVLTFQNPVKWVALDEQTAYMVAEALARSAFAVVVKEDVDGTMSSLIQKKRGEFMRTIGHLVKSMVINKEFETTIGLERFVNRIADEAQRAYL